MNNTELVRVRFTPDLRKDLNDLAASEATSPSEILRKATMLYKQVKAGGTDIDRRRQFTHEFLFLVVDKYLAQTEQATYDHLITEATRRVETLYARS